MAPMFLLIALAIPAFLVVVHYRTGAALLTMTALMSTLLALYSSSAITLFTESLPASVRAGAIGTVYALSIAIFGGSAQFIEQFLINRTDNPMAPAFYMTAALIVGMIGVLILKEPKRVS